MSAECRNIMRSSAYAVEP